jgi:hypothetical protein
MASVAAYTTAMKKEMAKRPVYKDCDMLVYDAKVVTTAPAVTAPQARAKAATDVGAYGSAYDVNVLLGISASPGSVTQA